MSSASVKRLLRSARECLGRREYKDALQHCKEALAEDKSCYEAYIFVGKAAFHLQEHAQAEAAYRRASCIDPRNPLAWQGLAELFSDTGSWAAVAECYSQLLQLADGAPSEDPLRGRRSVFLRRFAEAAARGGLLAEAEAGWRALLDTAADGLAAAEAVAAVAGNAAAAEAGVAAAEGELVDCLCRLADVQLAADTAEIEARVANRVAAETVLPAGMSPEQLAALEWAARGGVEAEWAEEALELDADHASATLRRIIALRPPSPPYVPYYDAFLKRLRKYIQAAPPGSMDRRSRRAVLLAAAKATMEGRCGARIGGCCSPYPHEAALAMLEVEQEVMGEQDPSMDPASQAAPSLEPPSLLLLVADCGRIAARLAHSFPWSPTAQLHTALSLRRRAAVHGFGALPPSQAAGGGVYSVARLPAAASAAAASSAAAAGGGGGADVGGRRRQVTGLLLSALSRGARAVSGWIAGCDMLLEEGAAEAALDAAKEGLKYVAHRDLVGKERLAGAGLLLRLGAARALLRLGKLEEAQLLLEGLAHGVSEGHVASGELAAVPPLNISQHAKRFLAHVAAARGDLAGARHRYDELLGGQLMGRSAAPIEAWAHGELGLLLLLLRQGAGNVEGARHHLQSALAAMQPSLDAAAAAAASHSATALTSLQQEAATYQLHLAIVLWVKGGGSLPPRSGGGGDTTAATGPSLEPYRSDCRELLLSAAAVAGPLQAAAFTWLGHWYERAAEPRDEQKARRCYQRALALDPNQAEAGVALVAALSAAGRIDIAVQLCEELRASTGAAVGSTAAAAAAAAAAPSTAAAAIAGLSTSPFLVYPGLLPAAAGTSGSAAAGGADAAGGGGGWTLRALARLQRDGGSNEAAVTSYQAALRLKPADSELWEGLAASYQSLGRHTAALKSYGRALELCPARLFSRLQAAALTYQMGDMPAALSYYRTALAEAPVNPAALLGCAEVLLAQAALAARMGAAGAAAAELAEAAALAVTATRQYGNLQAGWKLLGDIRMQHAAVPTLEHVAATREFLAHHQPAATTPESSVPPPDGAAAVRAGLVATRGRLGQLRSARRAYAAAVHLDPRVAGLWGDLAMSYHLQVELEGQHPDLASQQQQPDAPTAAARLRRVALSLARGGLRLDPAADWLWGCAGTIAAAAGSSSGKSSSDDYSCHAMAAAAEYCYSRALQLNPRRAPVWAALGRLYAAHGEDGLACRCFDAARSHEPTSVAVWEAMGDAALRRGGLAGPNSGTGSGTDPRVAAAWRDAADAYEHAQLLGGDVESRLGFVLGSLTARSTVAGTAAISDGTVLAAVAKATAMHPLLPSAHHFRGLALEARGDYAAAVQAFETALVLLEGCESRQRVAAAAAASSSAPLIQPFDLRIAPGPRAAVQLDLARVLVAAGRGSEAITMYDTLRQEGVVRPDDFGSTLSYAMALQQASRTAEAMSLFVAVLSAAGVVPPRLRIAAATAAVRIHVAARRWDEAYGIVLTATSDLPDEGYAAAGGADSGAAEAGAKLWRVLLAGLLVSRAPELESQLLAAMRQWAAGRRDLDSAQLECRVHELFCAKHRAAAGSGGAAIATAATRAALRQAALAVRACPYDRAARALLSHCAVQVPGPRHAVLAARAAPRDRAPSAAAVAGENAAPSLEAPLTAAPLAPSAAAAHAAGLVAAAAAAAAKQGSSCGGDAVLLLVAVREAAVRLRRVVHAQPHEAAAWYLCALTELQHAIASGGQVRLYRSAAVAARAAAARAKAALAALPAEPPVAAATAGRLMPGLPPVLALAAATQAARAQAAATDPRVAVLRAQRAALAEVCVRSLSVVSECRLQLRLRGHGGVADGGGEGTEAAAAREAAEEALRLASSHGVDASPAHRQLARLSVAEGNLAAANASYEQACRAAAASSGGGGGPHSYELLPALEWAAVRAASGETSVAVQVLDDAMNGAAASAGAVAVIPARPAVALVDVASVQRALLLLQLGEVESARAAAAAAAGDGSVVAVATAAQQQPSPALRAAAHSVRAAAALVQATLAEAAAEGGEGSGGSTAAAARKKSLLEAKWAAREALKPLSQSRPSGQLRHRGSAPPGGPGGPGSALAAVLLGVAEAGLGKEEAARELLRGQAARLWPKQSAQPLEVVVASALMSASSSGAAGGTTSSGSISRDSSLLTRAVHCRPWAFGEAWGGLVAAARAR